MTGVVALYINPSFRFAQTITLFARRALLPQINAPSLRGAKRRSNPLRARTPLFVPSLRGAKRRSNPLRARTPLFVPSLRAQRSNPLEAFPSLINHHLPHILPKYFLRFFKLFRCVLLYAFQFVFPSQRFVFVNA